MAGRRRVLAAWAGLLALVAATASADTDKSLDGYELTQHTRIYDAFISYPAPSWYQGKDPLDMSEMYRDQKGPEFILEQIPKGEAFNSWTRLYAVRGTYLGKGRTLPLDRYVNATLLGYVQMCGQENVGVSPVGQGGNFLTLLIFCQNSSKGQTDIGYGHGIGQITLIRFYAVRNTLLKVYQEWRGKAFLARDESSWPVPRAEVTMMIERFDGIEVSVSPLR
ncbi:hypothetical protein GCM10017083_00590 [Thalassobaculum fulvum]|uniref:Uncharacterized protein n=2 Tax=Thalassobaculum fulvum TaxID=1633335 RepID=A0A918XMF0_9PROT|nr:hypothetical protein GCM10017083_00590 [Thalassobaculum fulvum]